MPRFVERGWINNALDLYLRDFMLFYVFYAFTSVFCHWPRRMGYGKMNEIIIRYKIKLNLHLILLRVIILTEFNLISVYESGIL